ncbi:MAG: hypothetical protein ACI865_003399 [Flavobacteriaceae bacterium]|jgi:hypothetical protein
MKNFLLIVFCAFQSMAYSHDYFFAFAEMDYNDITRQFESTLVISSHDLERVLNEKELSIDSLDGMTLNSDLHEELSSMISKHFQINSGDQQASFSLFGAELLLNGTVEIYLSSDPIDLDGTIQIRFDLLMGKYPEQQNKLTLYHRDKTYTATFMRGTKSNNILLELN